MITLVIRLMAVWLFLSTLRSLLLGLYGLLQVFSPGFGSGPFPQRMLVDAGLTTGIGLMVIIAISIALFLFAPWIARFMTRREGSKEGSIVFQSVGPGDLYHIACFALGIYVYVNAVDPLVHALFGFLTEPSLALQNHTVAMLIEGVILLAVGTGLVFGARGIARFLGRLGHDPGDIPAQQFSLRVILIVVVGIAILLAIIKATVR